MKSNLILIVDLDGTCINVGDRFICSNLPPIKDRTTKAYQEWLDAVQTPELLEKDTPVAGMQEFVNRFPEAIYLTSRGEKVLKDTLIWLRKHNFPIRELIMRPGNDYSSAHKFKEQMILSKLYQKAQEDGSHPNAYNVIVIDDDTSGDLEEVCRKQGWVMLRAVSGGVVL